MRHDRWLRPVDFCCNFQWSQTPHKPFPRADESGVAVKNSLVVKSGVTRGI
jgi:hypothetical protein